MPSIPLVEDKAHPEEVTILVKSVQPFKNTYINQDPTQIVDVPDPNRVVEVDGRKYYPHTYSATVKIWTVTVSGVDLNGEAFLYTKKFSTTTTSNGSVQEEAFTPYNEENVQEFINSTPSVDK